MCLGFKVAQLLAKHGFGSSIDGSRMTSSGFAAKAEKYQQKERKQRNPHTLGHKCTGLHMDDSSGTSATWKLRWNEPGFCRPVWEVTRQDTTQQADGD